MRTLRTIALATTAAAALGTIALAPAQAATHPTHHAMKIAGNVHYTYLSDKDLPGGYVLATVKVGTDTVKAAAPQGSTIVISAPKVGAPKGHKHASAKVITPNLKHAFKAGMNAARAYQDNGVSIIANAEAVGFTPAAAAKMAKTYGEHPFYNTNDIITSPCASVSGDGGQAWGRACDVQKMMQDNGGGDWYVGDQSTGSGNDSNNWANLTGLAADVNYGGGNSVVQWSPSGATSIGQCTTINAGLSYGGGSVGASTQVCPDTMDIDLSDTTFGGHWSGNDSEGITEGVVGTDIVHSPASASSDPGFNVNIWWY